MRAVSFLYNDVEEVSSSSCVAWVSFSSLLALNTYTSVSSQMSGDFVLSSQT
jgi:hypothetical protein